jgi:hypothetical protein
MKVAELCDDVTNALLQEKQRVASIVLRRKMSEVDRARRVLKKLEEELKELTDTDVEDFEVKYVYS